MVERAGLTYKLESHHGPMLRLEVKTKYVRGQAHILVEFIDPCDRVTKLTFYEESNPFHKHDFKETIPNPKTREYTRNNTAYKDCTLAEYGLYKEKKI